jgi:hypothetical protein
MSLLRHDGEGSSYNRQIATFEPDSALLPRSGTQRSFGKLQNKQFYMAEMIPHGLGIHCAEMLRVGALICLSWIFCGKENNENDENIYFPLKSFVLKNKFLQLSLAKKKTNYMKS